MAANPKIKDVVPAAFSSRESGRGTHGAPQWIPASAEMTGVGAACHLGKLLDSALTTVLLGFALTTALVGLLRMIA